MVLPVPNYVRPAQRLRKPNGWAGMCRYVYIYLLTQVVLRSNHKTGNSMYLAGIKHYLEFVRQNVILLFNSAVSASLKDTHEERLKRLQRVNKVKKCTCKCIVYDRNPDVVAERLYIAGGYCEECKQKAPFLRKSDGTPYLEVHHIVPLSMNGEDSIENTIALCPNCHRKKHYG